MSPDSFAQFLVFFCKLMWLIKLSKENLRRQSSLYPWIPDVAPRFHTSYYQRLGCGLLNYIIAFQFLLLFCFCSPSKFQIARGTWTWRKGNWGWNCKLWYGWWRRHLYALLDWHHNRSAQCEYPTVCTISFYVEI